MSGGTDRQWLIQGALSLGVVATYLAVFAACALALQQPLPLVGVMTIVPLVLLSMVMPISIGGWGVREAVAASLWPLLGIVAGGRSGEQRALRTCINGGDRAGSFVGRIGSVE